MLCGAHCFILYLQAGFHLSPPQSSHAEDALKARQLLLLADGLYGLYTTHPSWHPEEEESNQGKCVPFFLTCTNLLPRYTAEMPAAAAPSATPCGEHIHCVTSFWKHFPRATCNQAAILSVHM